MSSVDGEKSGRDTSRRTPLRGLWAWAAYDWASNSFPTIIQTFVFASYFAGRVAATENVGTTWWGVTLGIAGLIAAVVAPVLGALAFSGKAMRFCSNCTDLSSTCAYRLHTSNFLEHHNRSPCRQTSA